MYSPTPLLYLDLLVRAHVCVYVCVLYVCAYLTQRLAFYERFSTKFHSGPVLDFRSPKPWVF